MSTPREASAWPSCAPAPQPRRADGRPSRREEAILSVVSSPSLDLFNQGNSGWMNSLEDPEGEALRELPLPGLLLPLLLSLGPAPPLRAPSLPPLCTQPSGRSAGPEPRAAARHLEHSPSVLPFAVRLKHTLDFEDSA